ncbi:MAG: amidohydrolase family protein, partial [Syntrophales bacterium]
MRIFHNGVFLSCGNPNEIFSAMIEDRGRIQFTGNEVPAAYQAVTDRMDLQGRCVLPAFADTHLHFEFFALFNATLDVRKAGNFKELADMIHCYQQNNPKEKVLLGFGSSAHTVEEKRLPDRSFLDTVTSKPLLIVKYDGHAAMGNTALLRLLPQTIRRSPGFDEQNGWLFQQAFYDGVNHISKSVSIFKVMENLIGGTDTLASRGIALAHTSEGVGFPLDADVDLMRFAARGL